jgi:hypothetical protein
MSYGLGALRCVFDYDIPTSHAFQYVKRKLKLTVVDDPEGEIQRGGHGGVAAADGIANDDRRWWFLGAKLWPSVIPYAAPNARAAPAAYRRELLEAEVAGGRSRRESVAWVQSGRTARGERAALHARRVRAGAGLGLASEMCRWTSDVPQAPATEAACKPRLTDDRIAAVRDQVRRSFAMRSADGGPLGEPPAQDHH